MSLLTIKFTMILKCVVCKSRKESAGEGLGGWVFTSQRVAMARVQLIFKLYEVTRREFRPGSVCPPCFDLVSRIDGLEYQSGQVQRALRARAGCSEDGDREDDELMEVVSDGDDPEFEAALVEDEDEEEERAAVARARKRRRRRARVKREQPDYDEEQEEVVPVVEQQEQTKERIDVNNYLKVEHHIKHENVEMEEGKPNIAAEGESQAQEEGRRKEKPVESNSNLDFDVTLTRTTRGQEQLVYKGHTYLRLYGYRGPAQDGAGQVTSWKCTSYYQSKSGCRAKLRTSMDGACVLLDSVRLEHNHPPVGERRLKGLLFREHVKKMASNHPEMRPADILANARVLYRQEEDQEEGMKLGLKDESLVRLIQRVRSKSRQQREQQHQQEHQQPEQTTVQAHQPLTQHASLQGQVVDNPPSLSCVEFSPVATTSYIVQVSDEGNKTLGSPNATACTNSNTK